MCCIIPRVNLVRNIGFDAKATHTVERDFADLEMHSVCPMKFPLKNPSDPRSNVFCDDLVFQSHYEKLEGRRNLWHKIRDRMKKIFS